jgi:hypothetical protein
MYVPENVALYGGGRNKVYREISIHLLMLLNSLTRSSLDIK